MAGIRILLVTKNQENAHRGGLGGLNPSTLENGAANESKYRPVLDSIWGLKDNVHLISAGSGKSPREPVRPFQTELGGWWDFRSGGRNA